MAKLILEGPIPDCLPVSGKYGTERLKRLEKRLEFLRSRIELSVEDLSFDKAEAAALKWAIETIMSYENKLVAKAAAAQ